MPRPHPIFAASILAAPALSLLAATPAAATVSPCYAFAQNSPLVRYANFQPQNLAENEVGLTYVGHSTFLIETASGVTVATDFAGWAGPGVMPEVVTMNHAHSTHYTNSPDPAIEHVLRGWNPLGDGPAAHDLTIDELRIRNVTTDITGWSQLIEKDGNSIFVFEIADLCIGHLGHLHHIPTDEQFAEIGFLDIVLAPVDGGYTMRIEDMIETLKRLRARVVIPMHAFGEFTLNKFVAEMSDIFDVVRLPEHSVVVSDANLPVRPTILVLNPYSSGGGGD